MDRPRAYLSERSAGFDACLTGPPARRQNAPVLGPDCRRRARRRRGSSPARPTVGSHHRRRALTAHARGCEPGVDGLDVRACRGAAAAFPGREPRVRPHTSRFSLHVGGHLLDVDRLAPAAADVEQTGRRRPQALGITLLDSPASPAATPGGFCARLTRAPSSRPSPNLITSSSSASTVHPRRSRTQADHRATSSTTETAAVPRGDVPACRPWESSGSRCRRP